MNTATRWQRAMLRLVALSVTAAWPFCSLAEAGRPTASSEWGPGYGAAQAADGVANENGNYWQTLQGKDKGAWWQQDLGQVVKVEGVKIVWARYEDKVHCPPARAVIQLSLSGAEGSWKEARIIAPQEIARDGQPYPDDREWRYTLSAPTPARYVRLLFPEGGQPAAKHPGYLCLGEVEMLAPGLAARIVVIEGQFGKAEIDVRSPAIVRLYLRGPGGLGPQSILALSTPHPWAKGACTYVVGQDGHRYESRLAPPEKVELSEDHGRSVLRILGVRLSDGSDQPAPATEDWTLSAPGEGSQLIWKIVRRWERDFTSLYSASPALFFGFNARTSKNSVTSTIWHDPLRLAARSSDLYGTNRMPGRVSENHVQTVRDRDSWMIYKLWTNWHAPSDLRLEVEGGHLYRRGSFALMSEAGAVSDVAVVQARRQAETERVTLKIAPVDKQTSGYQLAVTLPDKATEAALRDFYGSVFNGGAVNDQKGFDFGNESDGWYYAGSCWMYGVTLAAGTPAPGPLSAYPYDAASAFREHLLHVLSVVDDKGRAHFGYNQGGEWVDDNLHTILGTRSYLLHTGDLAFVRQNLPTLQHMLAYFIQRRSEQGLFKLDDVGAHWYYDAISTSGVNGYYNAFFYKAACDLAEMEAAAGFPEKAREYQALADSVKNAFNRVFWKEDAPGGPRYRDWIDAQGKEFTYFCDLCQWPPIAVGIASPEQARKIVATADARIKQLQQEHGYEGFAGLSALWPVPTSVNPTSWQTFGRYMNGGSLLCQTYWEIVARARAGDNEGAARRLRLFARRAAEISWAGDNAADIKGLMQSGDGEPYLADMVAATAGVIHGVMGITPTWDRLEVMPHLPADWPRAEADVLYKGRRHHVTIEAGKVQVKPREQVIDLPLLWIVDANWQATPAGIASVSNLDLGGGSSIALKRIFDDQGALGLWKLDEATGPVQDASPHRCHGRIAQGGVSRSEPGHSHASKAYRLEGKGFVTVPDDGTFTFGSADSFTVQCWLKTEASDNRVMLGKSGAYCVYVKNGKLAAWLMQDGAQFKEALGSNRAADGRWHHVAAVYDRQTRRLSLYFDGKLDTPDGSPGAQNPADISPLGPSTSRSELTVGSLGGGFPFIGWLDEVSVFRGAMKPAEFGVHRDYASPFGSSKISYAASGIYQSPPYDWRLPATLRHLTVAADLSGGCVVATVETSDDGFKTVGSRVQIPIRDGVNRYPLDGLHGAAHAVRVRFSLAPNNENTATPVVDAFRITAVPAKETPGK